MYFLPTSCDWLRLLKENNRTDKNKKTKQNKQKVIEERKFAEEKSEQIYLLAIRRQSIQKAFLKKLSGYLAFSYFHKYCYTLTKNADEITQSNL